MFKHGTQWVRADFHLHTRKDKEFKYLGEEDRFVSDYVNQLEKEEIDLGVITNHNKFDLGEYKAIKRKAKKKDIMIFPGVELSVKEGANGIHCLIIFKEDEWLQSGREYISQFLSEIFKGIPNYENNNTTCNQDLEGVLECLNTYKKDYFMIMAHVEQKSGFWKECNGGVIKSISQKKNFREKVLGFQKIRTYDLEKKVEQWMGYKLPNIEGSDCKQIDQVGKGKAGYIKLGSDNFESLVLALRDHENRVSNDIKNTNHAYIKSMKFTGGKLDDKEIFFSPELNTLIGIRGSGKSSIIEALRYLLDKSPSDSDRKYKEEIVKNILGSGGQVLLEVQDNFGKSYTIKRILGEKMHILNESKDSISVKIETLLGTPLYFGQKDLSQMNSGFELELLDKLVGNKVSDYKTNLIQVDNHLSGEVRKFFELEDEINNVEELKKQLKDVQHQIKIFVENGVADKLEQQINFEKDKSSILTGLRLTQKYKDEIEGISDSSNLKELSNLKGYESKENSSIFNEFIDEVNKVLDTQEEFKSIIKSLTDSESQMLGVKKAFEERHQSFEEDFAKVKREINIPHLNPDDFGKFLTTEENLKSKIEKTNKKEEERESILVEIRNFSEKRNQILIDELKIYQTEIDKINKEQDSLELSATCKGNKKVFMEQLQENFRGTGITNSSYLQIAEVFSDFTSLVVDIIDNAAKGLAAIITDNQLHKVKEIIRETFPKLLSMNTPNYIEIKYHGKELSKHSIGQRASALVLFILTQKENNLIIIDQPEDDLDNQVIYNEIIKQIKQRKEDVQFIFATHNANIPVLGDSEQVIAVDYKETKIEVTAGSIDDKGTQKKVVDIMEGGREAFTKRTEIYNLWK